MKRILLTVVLGVAVGAGAQDAAQPAQGQPAGSQSAAPVIKDPAEYNAYVAAVGGADANAKISGLEAFLKQYPNSIMKNQALVILMGTYQQTNNVKKTMETANSLVALDTCNVRALALLAYFDRVLAQSGDPNAKQMLIDGKKTGQQGLDCLPKVTDQELLKNKTQMEGIFHSVIGIACYQDKDYACAVQHLKPVVDGNPQDFSVVYPLALAYLTTTPPDYQNGIWFAARAAAVAPPAAKAQIEKYARSQYVKFHAGDDGWAEFLAAAQANGAQVAVKPAPTPAEQAHSMAISKKPEEMDFAMWEFILANGTQEDRDLVWNAIKGKPVQMNGKVLKATAEQFDIAGSLDDIEAKKPDITLTFEDKIPLKLIPKDGADLDFQGEPASYTPDPFMMTMEKGMLSKPKATTPVHKPPVHHKAQ